MPHYGVGITVECVKKQLTSILRKLYHKLPRLSSRFIALPVVPFIRVPASTSDHLGDNTVLLKIPPGGASH